MLPALRLITIDPPWSDDGGIQRAPKPGNGAKHQTTVLVVEDEVLVRLAIAGDLRDGGYRVLEAANAEEAQDIFRGREPVEIVFSDVNLPGAWKGSDLAAWVRREFPDVKVILTSGTARAAAFEAACDLFLAKPYLPSEVLAHIKRLLGS